MIYKYTCMCDEKYFGQKQLSWPTQTYFFKVAPLRAKYVVSDKVIDLYYIKHMM